MSDPQPIQPAQHADQGMRPMRLVYLQAQFAELHDRLRGQRVSDVRVRRTLDYFYTGELSLYATVHNLTLVQRRYEYWENV